jgi:hypothetical protein
MPNSNPTVTSIPNQTATEDIFWGFAVNSYFNDVDGDALTFSATNLPQGLSLDPNTGVISGTPTNAAAIAGAHSITITANDGQGGSTSTTFTITVNNTNDIPKVATPISDQAATEDSPFSLNVSSNFSDIDPGDSLTFTATGLPNGLTISNAGLISGSPTNAAVGTHNITVTATDQSGKTISDTFVITVANTNDAPTASTIPNQTATEDSFFSVNVKSYFTDVDGDTLSFTAVGLPDGMSISSAGVISGTPTNTAAIANAHTVTVTASDGKGGTVNTNFTFTVNNTNDVPTVANPIADQTATEDTPFTLNVSSNFSDIDPSDSLTFTATGLPSGLTISNAGVISGTPTNAAVGTHNITVTVTDQSGKTVSDTFAIAISNTNDAPTASTVPNQTATEDAFFSINVKPYFTDIDGDTLSFTATGLPDGMTISNTGIISGSASNAAAIAGAHTVTVTANDSNGGTVNTTFTITVNNTNDAPVVATAIADQNATEDSSFTLNVSGNFTDIDLGDSLTFTATGLPDGLTISSAGVISGTPTNAAVGTRNVTVTATDQSGRSVSDTFAITVANTNDAPTVVTPITNRTAVEDAFFSMNIKGNFTDMDAGDTLSFFSTDLPDGLTLNSATGVISGKPTNVSVGQNPITITASDGKGGTVSTSFILTVTNTNDAPTVVSDILDQNATEDTPFTLDVSTNFADMDLGDTLTFTAIGLPSGLSIDAQTGIITGSPTNGAVGVRTVTITATDSQGSTVSNTFDITVANTNDDPTVVSAIADKTATEDTPFTLNVSANFSDIDVGDALTYSANGLPAGLSINATTGIISGTPTNAAVGENNITVIATDSAGGVASATFKLTVNNTNDAPIVATTVNDYTATEDSPFSFNISNYFADPDVGDTLTFAATGLPTGVTIDSSTGVISGTPTNAAVGTRNITVTANDGKGGSVSDVFALTVINTNDAPVVASAIANKTATEDVAFTLNIKPNFSDPDVGNVLTFFASGLPDGLSLNSTTGVISGSPTNAAVGTHTVTVIADDGNGETVSTSFDIQVGNANDAPVVATPLADRTATEDNAFSIDVSGNFTDPDVGNTLSFAATGLPTGLTIDSGTGIISGTPTNAAVGNHNITVIASDGRGGSVSDTFALTVGNLNDDPTIVTPLSNKTATKGIAFTLNLGANFADIDVGDDLTYTITGLPAGLSANPNTGVISGTATAVGTSTVNVTVDDGNGGFLNESFNLTVAANTAPTLVTSIADQTAIAQKAFNFAFGASTFKNLDIDDTLVFSAKLANGSALPTWLKFNPTTRSFSGTPTQSGTLSIRVTATDRLGITVSDTFNLTIQPPTPVDPPPGDGVIRGTAAGDRLTGTAGDDKMDGLAGADTLQGRTGKDSLLGSGGNDTLLGGDGNDQLNGGTGQDKLFGNKGNDILTGGGSRDIFVLEKGVGRDLIKDFKDRQDKLGLSRGISFGSLTISQKGKNTNISLGNDLLAVLTGVQANQITVADFTRI